MVKLKQMMRIIEVFLKGPIKWGRNMSES